MADDYEDMNDIDTMTDDELHSFVTQRFEEHPDVDMDRVDLTVSDGRVILEGRVGTENEYQVIEHLLTDVIGVSTVTNDLVIDELVRDEQPEAADRANARVYGNNSASGGADRTEDSAEHLLTDTAAEQRGTDGMGEAIERGHSYNPPESPVQEGTWSKEDH